MIALLLAAALSASPSVFARFPAAGGGEIVLTGEHLQGRRIFRESRTEVTGRPVKLVRGDATLSCLKLTAKDEDDQFQWATCEGEVRFVRGDRSITCEKATYDEPSAKLTCDGNPELRSGKTVLNGKKLVYDLDRDEATLDSVTGSTPAGEADARLKSLGTSPKEKRP